MAHVTGVAFACGSFRLFHESDMLQHLHQAHDRSTGGDAREGADRAGNLCVEQAVGVADPSVGHFSSAERFVGEREVGRRRGAVTEQERTWSAGTGRENGNGFLNRLNSGR